MEKQRERQGARNREREKVIFIQKHARVFIFLIGALCKEIKKKRQRETGRDRERERDTKRDRERQREKQRKRQKERHTERKR